MAAQPVSISSLATPAEWARHHGLSLTTTYRLLLAGRLKHINVSAGTKHAAYRIDLAALPEQPDRSRDASAAPPNVAGPVARSHAAGERS